MSIMCITYVFHEMQLDDSGNEIAYFEHDLPHAKEIGEAAVKSWNEAHMEQYFDGILAGKIESCLMRFGELNSRDGKKAGGMLTIKGKAGVRFTEKIRNAISDQIDAQMSDGWGETFFGFANIMTMPDGTIIVAE